VTLAWQVGKPEENRPFLRPRKRQEDNTEMGLNNGIGGYELDSSNSG
jgi:hypothetical protein